MTNDMTLASVRIITADVPRLVAFYEEVTSTKAVWGAPVFAEIVTAGAVLAIGGVETVPLFGVGSAEPAANRSVIVEFLVGDVDAHYVRLNPTDVVTAPTEMPWGNRALLFRDPDGNLVNLFTPVSEAARERLRR